MVTFESFEHEIPVQGLDPRIDLATGILLLNQVTIQRIEEQQAPRNLLQLHGVGRVALINDYITASPDVRMVVGLRSVLRGPDTGQRFPGMNAEDWTRSDDLTYGHWMVDTVSATEPAPALNRHILAQASRLGIGPSINHFRSRKTFGSLSGYYEALDILSGTRKRFLFRDWPSSRYVSRIQGLGKELGRKPTESEIMDRIGAGEKFPSPTIIRDVWGSYPQLLDECGWPDIRKWTKEQFEDWGVAFMIVNEGMAPKARQIDYLSAQDRGPSSGMFYLSPYFDRKLSTFQVVVREKYEQKLSYIDELISRGILPVSLFGDDPSPYQRVRRVAQYRLLRRVDTDLSNGFHVLAAKNESSASFTSLVRQLKPRLSEDDIYAIAREMGIYDDIWKLEIYNETLKIPPTSSD